MPYHYTYNCSEGPTSISKPLACDTCQYNKDNRRCQRRVCIGLPYCWQHSVQVYHVRVKTSQISGKGLFVDLPSRLRNANGNANAPPFRADDLICPYNGVRVSAQHIHDEYPGDCVAPYAWCSGRSCEDAAAKRGIGSLANGEGAAGNTVGTNARLIQFTSRLRNNYKGGGPAPRAKQLWLQATKDIHNGEEIIVKYGESYWDTTGAQHSHKTKYKSR